MRVVPLLLILLSLSWIGKSQSELRGLEWEDNDYDALPLKTSYFKYALPPPSYYSLKHFCPKVINQSNSNTGVAWSAVWYARTMVEAIENGWRDQRVITNSAFSPLYNYQKVKTEPGCSQKIKLSSILESMHADGSVAFSEYREFCEGIITPELDEEAKKNRLPGYVRLFFTTDSKENKVKGIKKALYNNHPVVIGIIAPPSFSMATDFWQARSDPDREYGGIALTVVGYSDTKFGGALEVVNSWGNWATQGFTWLRYDEVDKFVLYGYELLGGPGPEISCSIFPTTSNGENMSVTHTGDGFYKFTRSYPTGTKFNAEVETNQAHFFYCLGFDENYNFAQLNPSDKSQYPWVSKEFLKFPLRIADYVELYDPPGKNYLCIIISGSAVDIEKQAEFIKNGRINYIKEINSISPYKWSDNQLSFSGPFNKDTIIIMTVELDQVSNK